MTNSFIRNESPKYYKTAPLLWLGVVLLVILTIAFLQPVIPNDYWWYLRIGREILATGSVPRVDTLTFSRAGSPVDYQSWGAAVLLWLVYRLGGLRLTILIKGFLLGATYTLVWETARRAGAGRVGASLVLLAAVLTSSNNWSIRPQLFTYPLFALALFILYQWQSGNNRTVWVLPFISLLWVNLHGSFVLLMLIIVIALLFGQGNRRFLALVLVGVLLATLVNPRGFGAWTYVYKSLSNQSNQQFSTEWLPPVNSGWQMNIFFLWLLGFTLLIKLSPIKINRLEWAWFISFGILALWGGRYVIWFVFILSIVTAYLFVDWEKKYFNESKAIKATINLVLCLFMTILPLVFLPGIREKWWQQSPPVTKDTPIAATEWLAEHPGLPGPLWSEIGFSSYIEFALPERPTWIDTRFEVFPLQQWQDYTAIRYARYNWESLLDATGANLMMVSIHYQSDLLTALENSSSWCELERDPTAVIYQRVPCASR